MQNNDQTVNVDECTNFNTIESVESVYPAEAIDIVDCISDQLVTFQAAESESEGVTPESAPQAANDEYAPGEIYSLNNARLMKKSRSIERRASKSRLTDRRAAARLTASGEIQPDRRKANRIANVEAIRIACAPQKQSKES